MRMALTTALLLGPLWAQAPEPREPANRPSEARKDAAGASEERGEKGPSNKLKWSTASEVDNFGYDVYRGDSEDGPFQRITKEPLLGAGTTDVPSYYTYVDDTIEPGRTYYYYVESISLSGVRQRFTPVIRARARPARKSAPSPTP